MITATIESKRKTVSINFPCDDDYLFSRLKQVGIDNPFDCTHLVNDINSETTTLSILKGKQVNLDFLNFLAKRLDSFDHYEKRQFEAAESIKHYENIKDIINLTYNLQNFTVVTDFSDIGKIGRLHYLTVNLGMSEAEEKAIDFEAMGKMLITSASGQVTPFGVAYENKLPFEEVFNGKILPDFMHKRCIFTVTIAKDDLTETLYLPSPELSIQKALHRLGAAGFEDCEIQNIDSIIVPETWLGAFCPDISMIDIQGLNALSKEVEMFGDEEFTKLFAIAKYADTADLDDISHLAKKIGSFLFVPDVQDTESLGIQQIKKSGSYKYDEQLNEFYNYKAFGEYLAEWQDGKFNEWGYVGIEDIELNLCDLVNHSGEMTMK